MPSSTPKQAKLMAMAAHSSGQAWGKKKGVKLPTQSVAKEFLAADQVKKSRPHKKKLSASQRIARRLPG